MKKTLIILVLAMLRTTVNAEDGQTNADTHPPQIPSLTPPAASNSVDAAQVPPLTRLEADNIKFMADHHYGIIQGSVSVLNLPKRKNNRNQEIEVVLWVKLMVSKNRKLTSANVVDAKPDAQGKYQINAPPGLYYVVCEENDKSTKKLRQVKLVQLVESVISKVDFTFDEK